MAPSLPSGVVTFVFTDIEGSTQLFRDLGERYPPVLERHREILREVWALHGGREVGTEGDSFLVAFADAGAALEACVAAQRSLAAETWPGDQPLRVRIGVHAGPAAPLGDQYVAMPVHQAARVVSAAHGGQVVASSAVVEAAGDSNRWEVTRLGEFDLRDFDDPVVLHQIDARDAVATFPAPRALPARGHNLTPSDTSFHGRTADLAWLTDAVERARLVTLVGAGGIGKTRLAIEFATRTAPSWAGGVWMVPLAEVMDEQLVPAALADAVGASTYVGQALDAVVSRLEGDPVLVILDNSEHLVATVARIVEYLLERLSELRIVVTSREALKVEGEVVRTVDPLPLEGEAPARQLFLDRASLQGDALSDAAQAAIDRVCATLDGVPLAIELAAARTALFGLSEVADHLGDMLGLLVGGRRTAPSHQQTLRATVQWSYDLLDEDERRCFDLASVFAGGFTMAAIRGVCPEDLAPRALGLVGSLVDRSLVRVERHRGQSRFRMLEPVRAFGRDRLATRGLEEAARRAHASFYEDWTAEADANLKGPEQARWHGWLAADSSNLNQALEWLGSHEPHRAVAMTAQLARFWFRHAAVARGIDATEAAIALDPGGTSAAGGRVRQWLGFFLSFRGDLDRARALTEEALRIAELTDDDVGRGYALNGLGAVASESGDPVSAAEHWRAAVQVFDEVEPTSTAAPLFNLGYATVELGRFDEARAIGARLEAAGEAANDPSRAAMGRLMQAYADHGTGNVASARRLAEAAREVFVEQSDALHEAECWLLLGAVAEVAGEVAEARNAFASAGALLDDPASILEQPEALVALARIELAAGDEEAASLFLESAVARRENGNALLDASIAHEMARLAAAGGERDRAVALLAASTSARRSLGVTAPAHVAAEVLDLLGALPETADVASQGTGLPVHDLAQLLRQG